MLCLFNNAFLCLLVYIGSLEQAGLVHVALAEDVSNAFGGNGYLAGGGFVCPRVKKHFVASCVAAAEPKEVGGQKAPGRGVNETRHETLGNQED